MKITYQSRDFSEAHITSRFVRRIVGKGCDDQFRIFDVDAQNYTIREYTIDRATLPTDIAAKADALAGSYPSGVAMPNDWSAKQ